MADFTWDAGRGVYRDAAGHLVPEADIRTSLDALIAHGQGRVAVLAQRLAEGQLDLIGFREQAQIEIRQVASASAMLAHGGRAQMTARERGWLGSQVRAQNDFLSTLSLDWAQGRMTPAQLAARLSMYPEAAGHGVYEGMRRRDAPGRGFDQERNQTGSGNVCDGCGAATAQGWVPIGTLPPPGARTCRARCRCTLQYRAVPARVATEAA